MLSHDHCTGLVRGLHTPLPSPTGGTPPPATSQTVGEAADPKEKVMQQLHMGLHGGLIVNFFPVNPHD